MGRNEEENSNNIFISLYLLCRYGDQIVIDSIQQQEQQPVTDRHAWLAEDNTHVRIFTAQEPSENRRSFESESQLPLFDLHDIALNEAPSSIEEVTHIARLSLCM